MQWPSKSDLKHRGTTSNFEIIQRNTEVQKVTSKCFISLQCSKRTSAFITIRNESHQSEFLSRTRFSFPTRAIFSFTDFSTLTVARERAHRCLCCMLRSVADSVIR